MERVWILITSLAAFTIVLITELVYVSLINAQDGPDDTPFVPRFVAGYLAVMAALIVVALVPRPEIVRVRFALRAAAAGGLLGLGILGAWSIGLPLVVAGILIVVVLGRTARVAGSRLGRLMGLVAAVLALGAAVVGLDVAGRVIVCPEVGTSGGGGTHLLGGTYEYQCNNGELHMTSG
jgi:hypothetical protein